MLEATCEDRDVIALKLAIASDKVQQIRGRSTHNILQPAMRRRVEDVLRTERKQKRTGNTML